MSKENERNEIGEQKEPKNVVNRIHITHFPVDKVPLREDGFDSGYEWVRSGIGRWIRVPKNPVVGVEADDHVHVE